MGRVAIIGIDGMDFDFVEHNLDRLPNLCTIAQKGALRKLKSVFPADSIPAWITIFTGLDPSEHGIIQSIDYLKKDFQNFTINTEVFKGKTFWDVAGREGRKVCIINPFMAYPVWPVNGIMVNGPVFVTGSKQAFPEEILAKYPNMPPLGGITDFPNTKNLRAFIESTRKDTYSLAQYALELSQCEKWDLFFVSFFTLDRIQHFLWRYTDPDDATYPGRNEYESSILEFYKQFDGIIGEFSRILASDDSLLVLSDHGHGRRCTQTLNLNEFLRRQGYLKPRTGRIRYLSKGYWIERVKNMTLQLLFSLGKEEYATSIAKLIANPKKLKNSDHVVSSDKSMARLADFAGMGRYGGISLSQQLREKGIYEEVRNKIIEELKRLDEEYGNKLFRWILCREDFAKGKHISVYPDIVFELDGDLGVSWGLYVPIITRNPFHRRISGGHKTNGILASNRYELVERDSSLQLSDVKRLILNALNISEQTGS